MNTSSENTSSKNICQPAAIVSMSWIVLLSFAVILILFASATPASAATYKWTPYFNYNEPTEDDPIGNSESSDEWADGNNWTLYDNGQSYHPVAVPPGLDGAVDGPVGIQGDTSVVKISSGTTVQNAYITLMDSSTMTIDSAFVGGSISASEYSKIIIQSGATVENTSLVVGGGAIAIVGGAFVGGPISMYSDGKMVIQSGAIVSSSSMNFNDSYITLEAGAVVTVSGDMSFTGYAHSVTIDGSDVKYGATFFSCDRLRLGEGTDALIQLTLNGFADGVYTLIHAATFYKQLEEENYVSVSENFSQYISLAGENAEHASLSFDEERGIVLTISGTGKSASGFPVPEPATYAMLVGVAVLVLAALRRIRA
ncbi:MAG: PEP-CTERM sorting domain-containing protein [Opitutaceae bacterium]|jgi:hypothetical protein|nr:PEP-CTERM sorting domain-containing protein [Opitutaceae bacterium]